MITKQYVVSMKDVLELIKTKHSLLDSAYILTARKDCYCDTYHYDDYNDVACHLDCDCPPSEIIICEYVQEDVTVCATCGAKEGENCVTKSGRKASRHRPRVNLMNRVVNLKL